MLDKILEITNPMLLGVGFIFMLMGIIMFKFPPKSINSLYGYRTASSMRFCSEIQCKNNGFYWIRNVNNIFYKNLTSF